MEPISESQLTCNHEIHKNYTQRKFDILKGFEILETRCINCHKILEIDIKKFGA